MEVRGFQVRLASTCLRSAVEYPKLRLEQTVEVGDGKEVGRRKTESGGSWNCAKKKKNLDNYSNEKGKLW